MGVAFLKRNFLPVLYIERRGSNLCKICSKDITLCAQ